MKTTIVMNEVIVKSSLTQEQMTKVKRFNPDALKIKDKDGNVEFEVFPNAQEGCIRSYAIAFDDTANDGKAAVKVAVCGDTVDEKKKYVAETYGAAITKFEKMEDTILDVFGEVQSNLDAIEDNIDISM